MPKKDYVPEPLLVTLGKLFLGFLFLVLLCSGQLD